MGLFNIARKILPERHRRYLSRTRDAIVELGLAGSGVTCPCCKAEFRLFQTHGCPPRPNARCPRCHSLERHRLLWMYLETATSLFSGRKTVLHLAPEAVFLERFQRANELQYFTMDLSSPGVDLHTDLGCLPFRNATFDFIMCVHVLEHVRDDALAMRELYRVLKPGGSAILQVPLDESRAQTLEDPTVVDPGERLRLFGQHDHVRLYGRDYADRIRQAAFDLVIDNYAQRLGDGAVRRFGLDASEKIYVCRKSSGSTSG